ncbi:MAG: HD family phosphohydrolase [Fidelibacterota bacterium]
MIISKNIQQSIELTIGSIKVNYRQIIILFVLVVIASLFFRQGKTLQFSYQVDDIAREPVIAPFNFPISKTKDKLESDLNEALRSEPSLFHRDQSIVNQSIEKLDEYFLMVKEIREASIQLEKTKELLYRYRHDEKYSEVRSMFQADSATLSVLMNQYNQDNPSLKTDEERFSIFTIQEPLENDKALNKFHESILQIFRNRWAEGILDISVENILSNEVSIDQGDIPILIKPEELNDLNIAWTKSKKEINTLFEDEQDIRREIGYIILVEFMKPNIIFDKETTERRQQSRLDRVPRNQGIMLKDEMIVDANQRITPDIYQKLYSLASAISKRNLQQSVWEKIVAYIGRLMIVGVVISFFFTFLLTYRSYIFNNWKMVLLISIIFVIIIGLTDLFVLRFELSEYLVPVSVAAMLLTILFDARIGFMGTISIALLSGILIGNDLEFIVTVIFISSVAMYMVRRLRTRSQFITTILAMIVASIFVVFAHGFFKGHSWPDMRFDLIYLMVISLFTPVITYGLIGIVEVSSGITTDLTLLELLDFNHPLLKRMQRDANGTFNHSIIVGNLAEACADAIDARALLCRVGAYYHDIGKMIRPEYFIENQYSGENIHDGLKESMSSKIIRNHVTEGLKLAEEYRLPKIVSNFIPMHHGTTKVEYFYRKAVNKAGSDEKLVDDLAFRYPGPKPNSKETGILMLCEAIEAAVRSIKNPDIFKVEDMIDKIIKKRLDDGQLDECPLTIDDLRKIKGSVDGQTGMLPVLRGIYHIRIEYPEEQQMDNPANA